MKIIDKSIDMLFVSKVRIKTLKHFLLNPHQPTHLRGTVRELKEEINAVRRELIRLEDAQILKSEVQGNRKYYRLNMDHPYIDELMGIFHKASGLGAAIIDQSNSLGTIHFAALTTSYIKKLKSGKNDVDLAIIGNVELPRLEKIVQEYEDKTGKEIHYTVMKLNEFELRKRRRDDFILQLMFQNHVMLIGTHEDFTKEIS